MQRILTTILILIGFSFVCFSQNMLWRDTEKGIMLSDYNGDDLKVLVPRRHVEFSNLKLDTLDQRLFFKDRVSIWAIGLDGTNKTQIIVDERVITGFDLDLLRNKIYYTDDRRMLMSCDLNGGNCDTLITEMPEFSKFLVDPFAQKVYWIQDNGIFTSDMDGSNVRSFVFLNDGARGLQIDFRTQKLYWLENSGAQRIMEADLRTRSTRTLCTPPDSIYPFYFYVAAATNKIYLSEVSPKVIYEYDLDDRQLRTVKETESISRQIVVDTKTNQIFWEEDSYINKFIGVGSISDSDKSALVTSESKINSFTIDTIQKRFLGIDSRGNVISTDLSGKKIKTHYSMQPDKINSMIYVNGKIYLHDGRKLGTLDTDGNNYQFLRFLEGLTNVTMVYVPKEDKIYFANKWDNKIMRINLDGSELETVFKIQGNEYTFTDLVYSEYTDRLYISNTPQAGIMSIKTDGSDLQSVYSNSRYTYTSSLAVDDINGFLYYLQGSEGHVYQTDLDTGVRSIFYRDIDEIDDLLFDPSTQQLYLLQNTAKQIAILTENNIEPIYSETGLAKMSSELMLLPNNQLIYSLYDSDFQMKKVDLNTMESQYQMYHNQSTVDRVHYEYATNDLWGINFHDNRVYKVNLDTDELTRYEQVAHYGRYEIIPENRTLFVVDETFQHLLKYNYVTSSSDTIFSANDFQRINALDFDRATNRIYFIGNAFYGFQSIDTSGNDLRVEMTTPGLPSRFIFNSADNSFSNFQHVATGSGYHRSFIDQDTSIRLGLNRVNNTYFDWHIINNLYEEVDADGDGFSTLEDCDDANPNINPTSVEIPDNGIDENCDGIIAITDLDGDGFGILVDCDDSNPLINPNAEDIVNNDIDENCDGVLNIIDNDGDGYNSDEDCDDFASWINPGEAEIPNNDVDENCDGIIEIIDVDGDGFNSDDDCNDDNPNIYPGAPEIPDNGIDEDCNGVDSTTTSIHQIGTTSVEIYPNPFDNYLIIKNTDNQSFRVIITDLNGKMVFDESRKEGMIKVDLHELISGTYYLQLTHLPSSTSETIPIIKQ